MEEPSCTEPDYYYINIVRIKIFNLFLHLYLSANVVMLENNVQRLTTLNLVRRRHRHT